MMTVDLPPRPKYPSARQMAIELGIKPGSHGYRKMVNSERDRAPSYQAYLQALAEWETHPAIVAERERVRDRFARAEARLDEARRRNMESWRTTMPIRGRVGNRSVVAEMVARLAYQISRADGVAVERSPKTETRYIYCGGAAPLRISGHELGYTDYGTRKQYHRGPELILSEDDTPEEALKAAARAVRDYNACERCQYRRSDVAKLLRAIRAAMKRAKRNQPVVLDR